jgi:hypothetical protein
VKSGLFEVPFNNSFIGEPPGAGTWGYGRFPVTQFKCDDNWNVEITSTVSFECSRSEAEPEQIVDLLSRITGAFINEARVNPDPEKIVVEALKPGDSGETLEKEL